MLDWEDWYFSLVNTKGTKICRKTSDMYYLQHVQEEMFVYNWDK